MTSAGRNLTDLYSVFLTGEREESLTFGNFVNMETMTLILTALGAVGGLECIKWIWNRKSNKRLASAQADKAEIEVDTAEFTLLREQLKLANEQILRKEEQIAKMEERFQKQTELVREQNRQLLDSAMKIGEKEARISTLEAERAMKLCERRGCGQRQPQSGY